MRITEPHPACAVVDAMFRVRCLITETHRE